MAGSIFDRSSFERSNVFEQAHSESNHAAAIILVMRRFPWSAVRKMPPCRQLGFLRKSSGWFHLLLKKSYVLSGQSQIRHLAALFFFCIAMYCSSV